MAGPTYSAEKEYETLRNELLDGRKYVFERPILIITVGLAMTQFVQEQYAVCFPLVIIGLLFFNLWFTVNRMSSVSRIVAYIQLVLENKDSKWYGWETSLIGYRKWLKANKEEKINLDDEVIYDNLGYYPTIYWMHLIITIGVFLILAIFTINYFEWENVVWSILTLIVLVVFISYAIKKRPENAKKLIEENRQIWKKVFEQWDELGV